MFWLLLVMALDVVDEVVVNVKMVCILSIYSNIVTDLAWNGNVVCVVCIVWSLFGYIASIIPCFILTLDSDCSHSLSCLLCPHLVNIWIYSLY